jgi:hypothetical protein
MAGFGLASWPLLDEAQIRGLVVLLLVCCPSSFSSCRSHNIVEDGVGCVLTKPGPSDRTPRSKLQAGASHNLLPPLAVASSCQTTAPPHQRGSEIFSALEFL